MKVNPQLVNAALILLIVAIVSWLFVSMLKRVRQPDNYGAPPPASTVPASRLTGQN